MLSGPISLSREECFEFVIPVFSPIYTPLDFINPENPLVWVPWVDFVKIDLVGKDVWGLSLEGVANLKGRSIGFT